MKQVLLFLGICLSLILADGVRAAPYPDKTVQVVVPFGPGGSNDVATRLLLKTFNKHFPREAVVINVAGAGGAVGARRVNEARPDGYNLLSFNTILPVLKIMGMLEFNYQGFEPVCLFAVSDTGVFVRNDAPWKNLQEFIDDAKQRPDKIRFGVGFGTLAHLGAIALEQTAGIDLNVVDTGGGEKKSAALMGNHIDAYFEPVPPVTPYLESRTFRCLGIFSAERNETVPGNPPTLREQGVDVVLMQNYGLFAPRGTPGDVLRVIREGVKTTCADPAFVEEMAANGLEVKYLDGQDYVQLLESENAALEAIAADLVR